MKMNPMRRLWLHVPVGLATVFALWVYWPLGILTWATFMSYEWIEDWRIRDHSYLDIAGYSWGLFAGIVIWTIIRSLI